MFYPSVDVNSSFIAGLEPVSNKAYKFSLSIIAVLLQLLFNVTGKEMLSNADTLSVQPIFQYRFGKNFVIHLTNTNKGCLGAKVVTMSTLFGCACWREYDLDLCTCTHVVPYFHCIQDKSDKCDQSSHRHLGPP